MKNIFASIGLLGVAMLVVACSGNPQSPYTVTGEFLVAEAEEVAEYMQAAIDAGQIEVDEPIDISATTVSIVQKVENDQGEEVDEILASGSFENGKIEFEGTIASPTKVSISVDIGSDEPLTLDTVVAPGQSVAFKLVDQLTPGTRDQLLLSGEYRIHNDSDDKYVVMGDLSGLDEDLTFVEVMVFGSTWDDERQAPERFSLGPVNPTDGKFLVEGTTSDPMVVNVYATSAGPGFYKSAQLIAEPGVTTQVLVDGTDLDISAPEGSFQSAIVDSWAKSEEYLAKVSAYEDALEAHQQEMEAQQEQAKAAQEESDAMPADETAEASEATEEVEAEAVAVTDDSAEPLVAVADATPNAEGCEHVDTSDFKPLDLWGGGFAHSLGEDAPEHLVLQNEVSDFRTAALQEIASNLDDPLSALLAVEMGAYTSQDDRLAALDKLATSSLDADLVAQRVVPVRDRMYALMESETNDKSLVPGQKAPDFRLASLEGNEVSLYETLASNDYVLIDFWASWCGPCIASFPKLKKLHAAFNDDGFEIISISIDATFDEWEQKSKSLELPWIDVGEIDGKEFAASTPTAYGVGWIPKGYLVDSKGCILNKDMQGEKLQELLVAEYGDKPELQEEAEEEESTPEAGEQEVDEA